MKNNVSEYDVVIKVKPEPTWLRIVDLTVRDYLQARNYPARLINDTAGAVVEAVEQLISLCVGLDSAIPFELGFLWQHDSVQVHLVFDASIPLNPHKEPDYEAPSTDKGSDHSLEGLWLHIIKHTMDRVFFRTHGKTASLVMVKYYRAEHLARRSWVMGLAPVLRSGLVVESSGKNGQVGKGVSIIHDIRGRNVLKLSVSDEFIVSRMDGKTTLREIYLEHAAELGYISPDYVENLYEKLESAHMLETASVVAELRERWWMKWLSPSFSIPHPDKVVDWIYRRVRFMFNPFAVTCLVLAGFSGLIQLFINRAAVWSLLARLDTLVIEHPGMIVGAYLVMLGHVAVHEFAHGVTCKHFGGSIRELGVMWYLAMFFFFCDTTSAWTFPKKSQRIWVSLSGPLVSWSFFGITAWFLGATAGESSQAVFWGALLLMNGFGLVMNFNPLVRMDAYYMLVDLSGIPNLQKKAFDHLKSRLAGWLKLECHAGGTVPSRREKLIFLVYGVLSAVMSLFFLLLPFGRLIYLWMGNHHFSFWGIMAFVAVALIVGSMFLKAYTLMRAVRCREYKIS